MNNSTKNRIHLPDITVIFDVVTSTDGYSDWNITQTVYYTYFVNCALGISYIMFPFIFQYHTNSSYIPYILCYVYLLQNLGTTARIRIDEKYNYINTRARREENTSDCKESLENTYRTRGSLPIYIPYYILQCKRGMIPLLCEDVI